MAGIVETSWIWRRTIVFSSLAFCGAAVGYLTVWGSDTALSRDIVQSLSMLAGMVIGSYVFGAAWDDRNRMVHGRFGDPSPPPPSDRPRPSDERG